MKIAIVIEGSTKNRSIDVENAVRGLGAHVVYNLGMKNVDGEPELTYMETGFISALLLNLGAVDFVIGGCGTGQGYMNMVLQFPGTSCGLLLDPVDAFLFSQVNAGNCISLALNKGYGNLAGDLNIAYLVRQLFSNDFGQGYPEARREIQINARKKLAKISLNNHKSMPEIIESMDSGVIENALSFPGVMDFIVEHAQEENPLKSLVIGRS